MHPLVAVLLNVTVVYVCDCKLYYGKQWTSDKNSMMYSV